MPVSPEQSNGLSVVYFVAFASLITVGKKPTEYFQISEIINKVGK